MVEKPLKNVCTHTPTYLPFRAKTGHFRQSCKGKPCLKMAWRILRMNVVMTGAVDKFLKGFQERLQPNKGLKPPIGWFCLRKFFDKKRRLGRKRLSSSSIFRKMPEDFLKKQNHRGSAAQIFFGPRGCKTFEKCTYTYACFPPFTGKRGQLGKSCQGKSCMRFS